MREIKVPRVSAAAFDKNRPASDLLKKQVAQLEHVVAVTRGAGVGTLSAKRVRTEGQAAKFIAEATRALNILPRPSQPPGAPDPTPGAAAAAAEAPAPAPVRRTSERTRSGGGSSPNPVRPGKNTASKREAHTSGKKAGVAKRRPTR